MPNDFVAAMSTTWEASLQVFGDTVTIGSTVYECIIHILTYSDGVDPGRAGRSAAVGGQIIMKATDWAAAGGRKGLNVIFTFGTFRVLNNPDVGPSSTEVILDLGPNT